ncbi:MAG: hydroxyacid dehydrogenase [Thermoplasmata archaeon]|nr:hydroxyacid dehydrogenase [Thermoplasmata archaeon]
MRVLVCDSVAKEAVEMLKAAGLETVEAEPSPEELEGMIGDFDGIIVRSRTKLPAPILEKAGRLKVIGRAGIGVDNIDVAKATEMGIPVVNAPTGSTVSVAELAVGMMLSLARYIPTATASMKAGKWEKKRFKGTELQGKTLGLVGVGRIGQAVGRRAVGFGMNIIYHSRTRKPEFERETGARYVDFHTLLQEADIISNHLPLTDETRGMFNAERLGMMKPTAFLINCARGGIVDEQALYDALREGKIKGAALDVYENEPPGDSPLFSLDNVVLTPHIGASTKEAQMRAGTIVAEQVIKVLRGEKPDHLVNRELAGRWEG